MDTKRKNNTEALIRAQAESAKRAIDRFGPDLLVTLDDNAFRTVALPLAGTRLPVVFSGLNGQPEDYNRRRPFMASREAPGGNITGVYEKLHIADAIQVHAKLFPGASPGAIPIRDAERYALVFNLNRAETLGIEIPSDVLMAADEVVTSDRPCGASE